MKPLPDLRLLHAFGNEDVLLEKVAGGKALAARLAIGLLEANRARNARLREEMLSAQAERMNHIFRMIEDQKMAPVREAARHTRMPLILLALQAARGEGVGLGAPLQGVPRQLMGEDVPLGMDEGMVRMASAIGSDLAHYALEKDAGIGPVLGTVAKGFRTGLKSMAQTASGFGANSRFLRAAKELGVTPVQKPGAVGQALSKAKSSIKRNFTPTGRWLAKVDALTPKPPPLPHQPLTRGSFWQGNTRRMLNEGKAIDAARARARDQALAAPYRSQAAAPQSGNHAVQQVQPPPPPPAQAAPPGGAAAGSSAPGEEGFDLQKAWQRTGLADGKWKWKLPALAAGAAGLYALHAGAKKGLEILGREPHAAQYNAGGAIPAYGVNQYGVPDRSTPFM